ncbi:hypothetical protein BGZ65_010208, partial [Modicella reniformis]
MNGKHFKGPVLDVVNSGRRYDPILEMMSNGRIEEMVLQNFDNLFQKMDIHSMRMASRLRRLTLDSESCLYTRLFKYTVTKLLERCPSLVELNIGVFNLNDAFEDLTAMLPILPYLEKLSLQRGNDGIEIEVFQGKIQAVKARIESLDGLSPDSLLLFRKGCLTQLEIRSSSVESCVSQLTNMIHWNARLRNIELQCDIQHSQTIMDAITSTREEILSNGNSCDLQQLRIYSGTSKWNSDVSIVVKFHDSVSAPTTSSHVRIPGSMGLEFFSTFFLQYGWCVRTLDVQTGCTDEWAVILDNLTQEKGSKITSLSLDDTSSLSLDTAVGVDCMIRVIDRSHDLQRLEFTFNDLHEKHQQEKMKSLVSRYGKRLNELKLYGYSGDVWIPRVMVLCPTRLDLPQLESFTLYNNDKSPLSPDCAQWIAAMVSPPTQVSAMTLSSQSNQSTTAPISESSGCGWTSLREITLLYINLQTDDWKVVIKSIDYSALTGLYIHDNTFSMDHFKFLVDCVPVNTNPVARLYIYISSGIERGDELDFQITRLRDKVPN